MVSLSKDMQVLTNTMANFKKSAYIVKQKLCREKLNTTFKDI